MTMHIKTAAMVCAACLAAGAAPGAANSWQGVTPEARISGRMVSPGYLKGKVVLLDCRNYAAKTKENIEAVKYFQTVWAGYKTKPFVVLGSHAGGRKKIAAAIAERCQATYPIYAGASVANASGENAVKGEDRVYVFDSTLQKVLYSGSDPREATGVAASAIMATTTPMTAKQFEYLLDWEIPNLPGQAFNRLKEYREKFKAESAKYDEDWKRLSKDAEITKLAKLVSFTEEVKDRDPNSKQAQKLTAGMLAGAIKKYESLKDSENPDVVQEAKNCLAELKWVAATLE